MKKGEKEKGTMFAMDQIETIKELQLRGLSPSEIARKLSGFKASEFDGFKSWRP